MNSVFDPKDYIRTIPNWPEPGVQFRDITTLLEDAKAFRCVIDTLVQRYFDSEITAVVGVDARGFILGAPLAYELKTGFVPVRKKGKLPFDTITESYQLEYGTAEVELHADALKAGDKVILVDDLIATGGTLLAASSLIKRLGAEIVEACAIIDLPDLGGSQKLKEQNLNVFALCEYEGE